MGVSTAYIQDLAAESEACHTCFIAIKNIPETERLAAGSRCDPNWA